jgi:hypothetical protein
MTAPSFALLTFATRQDGGFRAQVVPVAIDAQLPEGTAYWIRKKLPKAE